MRKPGKHSVDPLGSNDMPSTELEGNEISEEGLNSQGNDKRKVPKNRGSKPSRR